MLNISINFFFSSYFALVGNFHPKYNTFFAIKLDSPRILNDGALLGVDKRLLLILYL
jgi:hypothetical protein